MEQPSTGVRGGELDVVALHVAQRDRVFERSGNGSVTDGHDLESVAVEMDRMILHAHVEELEAHPLALAHRKRCGVGVAATVDGPRLRAHHAAGEDELEG